MSKLTQAEYLASGGGQCPNCGSTDIEGHEIEVDANGAWQRVECNNCAAEWHDIHKLIGYEMLNIPDPKDLIEETGPCP